MLLSCREIWSCFSIYTLPNICCIILCSLWPCRYAVVIYKCLFSFILFASQPFSYLPAGSVGLSFLQFTNMNSMRSLFITGLSLFLGISIPQFFNEYWTPTRNGLIKTNAGWVSLIPANFKQCLHEVTIINWNVDSGIYSDPDQRHNRNLINVVLVHTFF